MSNGMFRFGDCNSYKRTASEFKRCQGNGPPHRLAYLMERDSCAWTTARSWRTSIGFRRRALASTWLENASSDDDTMMIGMSGSLDRISRHSSAPNKPGICQSMMIRQGWNACKISIARRPFPAARTS